MLDLSATYKLDNWDFTLGGDNVLDEYPDEVLFANSTSGQIALQRQLAVRLQRRLRVRARSATSGDR